MNRVRQRSRPRRGRVVVTPDRRTRLLLLAATVLLGMVVILVTGGGDDGGDLKVPAETPLPAYRVVYDVRELGQKREETVVVRRPYESRRSSTRDGELFSGTLVNAEGLWQFTVEPSPGWSRLYPGRRRAEGDERPLAAIGLLLQEGLAELRPNGIVLNRPCTRFRAREPIGTVASQAPTQRDHVELCLDRTGVVLQERWVSSGRLVRIRNAIHFDPVPSLGADAFAPTPESEDLAAKLGGGGRRELPFTDKVEASLNVRFDLPSTVKADGGTVIVNLDAFGRPKGGTVVRFFRSGDDVVDVEEVESEAVATDRAIAYDVPTGRGFVETDLRTVTLKVVLPTGVTVIMRGASLDLLDNMADAMHVRSDEDSDGMPPGRRDG